MRKLDITIFDLLSEKDDSAYVLIDIKKLNEYINLAKSIESELEALKKPPTVDEVCALIEKDIKGKATYSRGQFYIDNEKVDDILFGVFRAKTLISIGKFYEELEVKE